MVMVAGKEQDISLADAVKQQDDEEEDAKAHREIPSEDLFHPVIGIGGIFHQRAGNRHYQRRLAAGHFLLKPTSYSIYPLQSSEKRVQINAPKPTATWHN